MNKYAASGLVNAAARDNRHILVIVPRVSDIRHVMGELTEHAEPAKIRRAHGYERIEYPSGGSIRFASLNNAGHRGVAVDTLYMDGVEPTTDVMHELMPCIATSTRGEIIAA